MACFFRTFLGSQGALQEKTKIDQLETAVLAMAAQLEEEKAKTAALEQQLSQVKTEADVLRRSSASIRSAASMKMQRWWSRSEAGIDGGSEKSCASTADESTADSGSDTEPRCERTSTEESEDSVAAEDASAPVDVRP